MNLKTVTIDNLECQMDQMAALHVTRTIRNLEDKIKELKDAAKKRDDNDEERDTEDQKKDSVIVKLGNDVKTRDEQLKAKDGEIVVLKQQVVDAQMTPQKLNKYVVDRLEVINKAKQILGDKYTVGDKTDDEIRKDVVVAKLGDAAAAFDAATSRGAFEALATVRVHDAVPTGHTNSLDTALRAFGGTAGKPGGGYGMIDAKERAYDEYNREVSSAYRGKTN